MTRLLIISGLSGSGKTTALHTLEDLGYYCIDNMPIGLVPAFVDQILAQPQGHVHNVGLGIDARNLTDDLPRFPEIVKDLKARAIDVLVVYLEADDDSLIKRFSETRRRHPLTDEETPLTEAIMEERAVLAHISENADLRIDTSHMNVHLLRDLLIERLADPSARGLSVLFTSFGYKHGVPADADFVFDVRCLPNPHWEPNLRTLTGLDPDVQTYLANQDEVALIETELREFLERWMPRFRGSGKTYLTVALGCTGGQHRSVYLIDRLARHFRQGPYKILVRHRELP